MKRTEQKPEFNVKRYLDTVAYQGKREEIAKELNFNSSVFNFKSVEGYKLLTNRIEPKGVGKANTFYKTPEERNELKKAKKAYLKTIKKPN